MDSEQISSDCITWLPTAVWSWKARVVSATLTGVGEAVGETEGIDKVGQNGRLGNAQKEDTREAHYNNQNDRIQQLYRFWVRACCFAGFASPVSVNTGWSRE